MDGGGVMVRAAAGGVTLTVRAQPGAKKTAITGVWCAEECGRIDERRVIEE